MTEQNAMRAVAAVKQLAANGERVRSSVVARHLEVPDSTAARWLKSAEHLGLVRSDTHRGWMPA